MAKQDTITIQLEEDLKKRFEERVKSEERTVSQRLRLLIKEYLGEQE